MHPDDTTRDGRCREEVTPLSRGSKYRITGKVGEGGMGVVHKALDVELGRTVALKFLPPHTQDGERAEERLLREARAASSLDHVHVGAIHAIEQDIGGRRFIVMAYYEGESLASRLERASGPLARVEALRIALQLAEGLRVAHESGITHRDIKPSNILITKEGVVKIVDLGLAHVQGSAPLTRDGTQMGTPAYMSPEQALGGEVDHRTDIWSLGAVLHEMLTGEQPFQAQSLPATLYQVVHGPPRAIELVDPALRPLLKRALAKDPAARYSSASELLGALRAAESNASAEIPSRTASRRSGDRNGNGSRRRLAAAGATTRSLTVNDGTRGSFAYSQDWPAPKRDTRGGTIDVG